MPYEKYGRERCLRDRGMIFSKKKFQQLFYV